MCFLDCMSAAAAISNGDVDSASSLEADVDRLNAEEYALNRKSALFKSVDVRGDDAIFERLIIQYRNYLTAKESAATEKRGIYNVFASWEKQRSKLLKAVDTDQYRSTFLDDQIAILLHRHEPVDITGHSAGGHTDALRRYLEARVTGAYDKGFEGTPAGDKLREMEGKPLFSNQ